MKKIIILSLLSFSLPIFFYGQKISYKPKDSDIEQQIKNELDSFRMGINNVHNYHFDSSNEKHFLEYVRKFDRDESVMVRYRVQGFKGTIAFTTKDLSIRQEIVEDFLTDVSNPEQTIAQRALGMLLYFNQIDFSKKSKEIIISIFDKSINHHNFLLVCGTAQVRELLGKIRDISKSFNKEHQGWERTIGWYASLAAARMGDTDKVDELIVAVTTQPDLFERIFMLKYLAYTRQPKCIKLLQKYLEGDERMPRLTPNYPGFKCNQYALEYLARYLDDFPFPYKDSYCYSQKELDTAIAFMREKYGTVKTEN